jgi:hypothetical protein
MAVTSGAAAALADLDSLYRDLRAAHQPGDSFQVRISRLGEMEVVVR